MTQRLGLLLAAFFLSSPWLGDVRGLAVAPEPGRTSFSAHAPHPLAPTHPNACHALSLTRNVLRRTEELAPAVLVTDAAPSPLPALAKLGPAGRHLRRPAGSALLYVLMSLQR